MSGLIIFDFDGTLFDTHESIVHCVKRVFEHFQPDSPPDLAEMRRLISRGTGLFDTFAALRPKPETYNEKEWETKYRELYAEEGQLLVKPYPGAKECLLGIKSFEPEVMVAIVTNKGIAAVHTALENHDMADLVPRDLIVGDKTPGNTTRKPDTGSFTNILVPNMRANHGVTDLDPTNICVVGDTEADLLYAERLGACSCWCAYGYGDQEACAKLSQEQANSLREVFDFLVEAFGAK